MNTSYLSYLINIAPHTAVNVSGRPKKFILRWMKEGKGNGGSVKKIALERSRTWGKKVWNSLENKIIVGYFSSFFFLKPRPAVKQTNYTLHCPSCTYAYIYTHSQSKQKLFKTIFIFNIYSTLVVSFLTYPNFSYPIPSLKIYDEEPLN